MADKYYKVKQFGGEAMVRIVLSQYSNKGLAVRLITDDGDPYAMLSVWFDETPYLPNDVFYGKHWSENEGLLEQLQEQGTIELVESIPSRSAGFVEGIRAYKLLQ